MKKTNITAFRKDIYKMMESAIEFNEPINVTTKKGNAVVLSEDDHNSIMETLYLSSISGLKEDIVYGMNEDTADCISEESPYQNPPPYEKLIDDLSGAYSRRIKFALSCYFPII